MPSRSGGAPTLALPVTKNANYSAVASDNGSTFFCTGPMTLTLPTAASGLWYRIANVASTAIVAVALAGTNQIRLAPGESITFYSDGSVWVILESKLHVPLTSAWRMPATANSEDDEFLGGSKDAAWTRALAGGDTPSESYTQFASHLAVLWNGSGNANDELLLTKTIAPSATCVYNVGIRATPLGTGQYVGFGLFDATVQEGIIAVARYNGASPAVSMYDFTGGAWGSAIAEYVNLYGLSDVALSLTRISNQWLLGFGMGESISANYIGFHSKTFTVARGRLIFGNYGSSLFSRQAVDFFRRTT